MWKYVSRRVKDTLERTCNVLDVSRTSFCSSSGVNSDLAQNPSSCGSVPEAQPPVGHGPVVVYKKHGQCMRWIRDRGDRFSGKQNRSEEEQAGERQERERLNHQEEIAKSWLGALTWSSAVVCGWYTSQFMCLRRKRMGWTPMDRQQSMCMYANLLINTTRSLHTNATSRIVYAAPPSPPPPRSSQTEVFQTSSIRDLLHNVNNPVEAKEGKDKPATDSVPESWSFHSSNARSKSDGSSSSLDSVIAEFSGTIAEIEYQFAVQDLEAEHYKSAVNHLKLATTHHHPAATFNLGLCYERGLGVERDLSMAMKCYTVASSQGHPKAIYNLGVYYARGLGGLKRSRKAALECFVSAARLGQEEAQLALDLHRDRQEHMPRSNAGKEVSYQVHAY